MINIEFRWTTKYKKSEDQAISILLQYQIKQNINMNQNQIKIVRFQFVPNYEVTPHEASELQHLCKKNVLQKQLLQYNSMLTQFINEQKKIKDNSNHSVCVKQLEQDKSISAIDRIQILNNTYKNKAELILKVPSAISMPEKQIKNILDLKKK